MTLNQASLRNVGVVLMLREKLKWEDPMRVRVAMQGTGTDQPVLVKKSRNGDGAKGLDHPALPLVNQRWEEPNREARFA